MASGAGGPRKALNTTEARKALPRLVRAAARRSKPGDDVLANAVAIQPRGEKRSAYLVPEVDIEAIRRQVEELEEELEDIALMRLIEERIAKGSGKATPIEDVIRELGYEDLLGEAAPE